MIFMRFQSFNHWMMCPLEHKLQPSSSKNQSFFIGNVLIFFIVGTIGNDDLVGTSNSEVLAGGVGKGILTGGIGADAFLFQEIDGFGGKKSDLSSNRSSGIVDNIIRTQLFSMLIKRWAMPRSISMKYTSIRVSDRPKSISLISGLQSCL